MRQAQIQYRDQKQLDYALAFKTLPEEEKEEHRLIHSIQTTACMITFYDKRPTKNWPEGGREFHLKILKERIDEYESKYGKYELQTI